MLEYALKAHLPIISVTTDDMLNVRGILQLIAGRDLSPLPPNPYYTSKVLYLIAPEQATETLYRKLLEVHGQAVVINPPAKSHLVFDAGFVHVPEKMLEGYLRDEGVSLAAMPAMKNVVAGLSIKGTAEVLQLTQARTGGMLPVEVRRTLNMLGGSTAGAEPLSTDYAWYQPDEDLQEWATINRPYFFDTKTPHVLMPRGVVLHGVPGTGKTTAARYLAKTYGIPLYRLNIAGALSRWMGESEARVQRALTTIEKQAPCVMLLDEIEKLFASEADNAATTRILGELLWWLEEHRARVLTVMTTNDLPSVPGELYRPGRIDKQIRVSALNMTEALDFAGHEWASIVGAMLPADMLEEVREAIKAGKGVPVAHARVAGIVHTLIKKHNLKIKS